MKSRQGKRTQKARRKKGTGKSKTAPKSPTKVALPGVVIPDVAVSVPGAVPYNVTTTPLPPNVQNRVAEILRQYAKCKCK